MHLHKQDLLSDGYKADCDVRGHGTGPVPSPQGDTEWTKPKSDGPASAKTMREVGYPREYEPDDQE